MIDSESAARVFTASLCDDLAMERLEKLAALLVEARLGGRKSSATLLRHPL